MENNLVVSLDLCKKIYESEKLMNLIKYPTMFYWVEYILRSLKLSNVVEYSLTQACSPKIVYSKNIITDKFQFSPIPSDQSVVSIITPAFTYNELLRIIPSSIEVTIKNQKHILNFNSNHSMVMFSNYNNSLKYIEKSDSLQNSAALFLLKYYSTGINIASIN